MNLTQAEAIASLYQELLNAVDREAIPVPVERTHQGERPWPRDSMDEVSLEDGKSKLPGASMSVAEITIPTRHITRCIHCSTKRDIRALADK